MKALEKLLCFYMGFFIVLLLFGCSHIPFNNVPISSIDFRKDVFFKDSTLLSTNLNKSHFIEGNRYSYNYIDKGSYSSSCYTVKAGDTLFYIAWITGHDCQTLAKKNNIDENDILRVGQILQVDSTEDQLSNKFFVKGLEKSKKYDSSVKKNLNTCDFLHLSILNDGYVNHSKKKKFCFLNRSFMKLFSLFKNNMESMNNVLSDKINFLSKKSKIISNTSFLKQASHISWNWPTSGKIISTFSNSEGGNKGIDISGVVGQPIYSASYGKVVYAGDALFGYGNLIIIKHSNDFLSTYAHNDEILVIEQQSVTGGQRIATMGSSGSDLVKLHFEIRYKGKSVDPLYYLPKK